MHFIAHRINTIKELQDVPKEYGVEIDLRDQGGVLILVHDPFEKGEDFEEFLRHYEHGTLICNIKSERIEYRVQELLKKYGIENYFFLDSSFPMIHFLSKEGEKNMAVRLSEYESIETVLAMAGRIDWVWVDCFTKLILDKPTFMKLKEAGFNICLVSPELQGRPAEIAAYRDALRSDGIELDAVCTKLHHIPHWQSF